MNKESVSEAKIFSWCQNDAPACTVWISCICACTPQAEETVGLVGFLCQSRNKLTKAWQIHAGICSAVVTVDFYWVRKEKNTFVWRKTLWSEAGGVTVQMLHCRTAVRLNRLRSFFHLRPMTYLFIFVSFVQIWNAYVCLFVCLFASRSSAQNEHCLKLSDFVAPLGPMKTSMACQTKV